MELVDYLTVVRRRLRLIALALVLGALAAGVATVLQQERFTSSTKLIVAGGANESSVDEMVRRQLAAERAHAYALLLSTAPAIEKVVTTVGVSGANPQVSAFADGTTPFITIVVAADTPSAAKAIADGYAPLIPAIVAELEQTPTAKPPTITPLTPANLPTSPTSPQPRRDIPVGAAAGLLVGLIAAFLRESLDLRVRESSEIEKTTESALLGTVPRELDDHPLPTISHPRSGRSEAYRHIRANLEFTTADGMPRSIAVTSPAPGEGKSTVAANLALAASRAGYTVLLVDADLRKPTVAKLFAVPPMAGLSDVLTGRTTWPGAVLQVPGERLHVLTSGGVPRSPSELIASAGMSALLDDLERHFDLVVIDTPPLLPVSDAVVVGVNTGGVVLVARMGYTRRLALRRAVESLRKVNAPLMGVVANAVVRREEKAYGEGYGYAYGYHSETDERPSTPAVLEPARRRGRSGNQGRHARRGGGPGPIELPESDGVPLMVGPNGSHPASVNGVSAIPAPNGVAAMPPPNGHHRAPDQLIDLAGPQPTISPLPPAAWPPPRPEALHPNPMPNPTHQSPVHQSPLHQSPVHPNSFSANGSGRVPTPEQAAPPMTRAARRSRSATAVPPQPQPVRLEEIFRRPSG